MNRRRTLAVSLCSAVALLASPLIAGAGAAPPKLTVASLGLSTSSVQTGGTVAAGGKIANTGNRMASADVRLVFTSGTTPTTVVTAKVTKIKPHNKTAYRLSGALPAALAAGTYTVTVCVASSCKAASGPVTVTAPVVLPPPITPTPPTTPSTPTPTQVAADGPFGVSATTLGQREPLTIFYNDLPAAPAGTTYSLQVRPWGNALTNCGRYNTVRLQRPPYPATSVLTPVTTAANGRQMQGWCVGTAWVGLYVLTSGGSQTPAEAAYKVAVTFTAQTAPPA